MPPKEKKNSKENVEKAVKALKDSATVAKKQTKPVEKNTKDNAEPKPKKTTKKQTKPVDSNEPTTDTPQQPEKKKEPSGFMKPIQVSTELNNFFSNEKDTLMSRTEVTRKFTAYIKENKLQDPENGRKIHPDPKLKALLRIQDGEELTFFNLQRYMSPHFSKAGQPSVIP